jgi:hypothetical protein
VKILGSDGRPAWKTAASSPRGGKHTIGYVKTKSCFGLEILNSVLVIVFRHTGRLSPWHFSDTSFEPMWGIGEWGRGWLLPVNFGLVCYVESDYMFCLYVLWMYVIVLCEYLVRVFSTGSVLVRVV